MNSEPEFLLSHFLDFSPARLRDYWELTKPRLVSLILLSTAVGFFLGLKSEMNILLFGAALLGTVLVAAGSMVLNQWMERHEDARMMRTAARPLPSGRLHPAEALIFGVFLSLAGLLILFVHVNASAGFLAALTLASYLSLYTPLKKKTSLCTIVGAVPGALPPLIGWAAAAGRPPYQAWILFAIIFLWQMPHFLSIAWLYRDDYIRAEFRMLSVDDPDGRRVGRQIILYSLALVPVSLLPTLAGLTGYVYFFSALVLGYFFTALAVSSFRKMDSNARHLFRASILYLALILFLMIVDKT